MANTLIFCFDGTYSDPKDVADFADDTSVTNIFKLHAMFGGNLSNSSILRLASGHPQHSFYYSGVGTYGNIFQRVLNAAFAPEYSDVKRIIQNAKQDFVRNYRPGSCVLIFGFSRGAAIARRFASVLWWERRIPVRLLGVFDTIAVLGDIGFEPDTKPPSVVSFSNGTMSPGVEHAVHVVALDDQRSAFQPALFNADPRILEVWFPGAHGDIGGGFWYSGLADLTLQFMMQEITKHCQDQAVLLDPNDSETNSKIDYAGLGQADQDFSVTRDDLAIHPLAYGKMHEQRRDPLVRQLLRVRAVCVNEHDQEAHEKTPVVHWSVQERFASVVVYRPIALRGRKYQILGRDGTCSEALTGIHDLRESVQNQGRVLLKITDDQVARVPDPGRPARPPR